MLVFVSDLEMFFKVYIYFNKRANIMEHSSY